MKINKKERKKKTNSIEKNSNEWQPQNRHAAETPHSVCRTAERRTCGRAWSLVALSSKRRATSDCEADWFLRQSESESESESRTSYWQGRAGSREARNRVRDAWRETGETTCEQIQRVKRTDTINYYQLSLDFCSVVDEKHDQQLIAAPTC